ncbi:MAG TPA: beta galactosidase jelly roll domain-containing protein [Terriglobales bacterium]|nr:beta galactosidase jelly roll domain-containing protein [Terriglobales bacterium]
MKVFRFFVVAFFPALAFAQSSFRPAPALKFPLREGWALQSSVKVAETGEAISSATFQPKIKDWLKATVPTTVVASQVKSGLLPDPFYGMNLRQYPGVGYPIGFNFSNIPMPPDSPYAVSWWYRKQFALPNEYAGKTVWLNFRGINYRANIFLNGKQIANSNEVAGAWRTYEFNIASAVKPGENVLAVQVYAPTEASLAITFVDWNPAPPDKNMGLWREVYLTWSGPVALRHPAVVSKVDSPANNAAHLTVTALVKNASDHAVKGTLEGRIEKIELSQPVELAPGESKNIVFTPEQYPQLNLTNPRLWWPTQMGTPNLYDFDLSFELDGKVSDSSHTEFGIREITSEVAEHAANRFKRLFKINGKNILIRGGGWTPDMMLRQDSQRLADEFRYVRDIGLNTIRLEGKLETEEFLEMADRQGILVMAGWCCCDFWEHWGNWKTEDFGIAQASLRDQIYRLRSHPSMVVWLNGSDNPPPPDVEEMYLKVEQDLLWPNPVVSSATAKPTTVTGESGGKMSGPYEYVAPSYWMSDPHRAPEEQNCNAGGCGGAYGFNTETSMGPAVPTIESVRRMVPKDHLWPVDEYWNFHAGGGAFKDLHVFTDALNARYGQANSAEEFTYKSQLMTYEGVRAMYEAYSRNKYTSTGVIQWMLNNAWPSMIWHLYDYYLQPGGGYFGAKKAMQALDPVYGYDDHSVWLVSSQYADAKGLKLTARVFNLDGAEKFSKNVALDAAADSAAKVFELPGIDGLSPAYFLDLRVTDASGKLAGSNFYWLSTKPETIDWAKSNWYTTPTASYADYTSLAQLPKTKLNVSSRTLQEGAESITRVTLENPSKSVALFVRLKVDKGKGGEEILPVVWQDNYVSLLPGEKRDISATYRTSELGKAKAEVEVSGWNVH